MRLACVKEVYETSNGKEVNFLLSEGWLLHMVHSHVGKFYYLLIKR